MKILSSCVVAWWLTSIAGVVLGAPLGTAFTYQGRLTVGTNAANGLYDLRFTLYDAPTSGNATGGPITTNAVPVNNGSFSVFLDFGPGVSGGEARWLDIAVRGGADTNFTSLAPRQALTPAPAALYAPNAGIAAAASNLLGTLPSGQLAGAYSLALNLGNSGNTFAGTFTGNAAGLTNISLGSVGPAGTFGLLSLGFPQSYSVGIGTSPTAITSADLNADGWPDLVSSGPETGSVYVFLNDRHGGLLPAMILDAGGAPSAVVAADMNNDRWLDLVTANSSQNTLSVLPSDQNGGFGHALVLSVGGGPVSVAAADVNGDGWQDLIGANSVSSTLSVLTNNRRGGFVAAATLSVGAGPRSVTTADVNRDGWVDLISANYDARTVSVLTNRQNGQFALAAAPVVGFGPSGVVAADLSKSGWPDLVTANRTEGRLAVLRNSSGGYPSAAGYEVGAGPQCVAAADLNRDGWLDLVSANTADNTLTVLTNNLAGGFGWWTTVGVGGAPVSVAAADVTGDGWLDLISANATSNSLSILPQSLAVSSRWAGTFTGNGAGVSNVNAGTLTGTLADARLSSNVARLDGNASFLGTVSATNFTGNGAGLTGVRGTLVWQVVGATQAASPNTGYLVNSPTQVSLTLPPAPAPADIVRVASAGQGGWKLVQNSGQSIQIANIHGLGALWTLRDGSPPGYWLDVASSSDGSKLVAVEHYQGIFTSSDSGATWVPRLTNNYYWSCVASSADGSKLVAGVDQGQLYTSTDAGTNWTARGPWSRWGTVASSSDGSKLIACNWGFSIYELGDIYFSTNSGVMWEKTYTAYAQALQWNDSASSADGKVMYVADYGDYGGHKGESKIMMSTDFGQHWSLSQFPAGTNYSWVSVAVSADGTRVVACDSGGMVWTAGPPYGRTRATTFNADWARVASSADGMRLFAAESAGPIYFSTDAGSSWTPSDISRDWIALACTADGLKAVAADYWSGSYGHIYTSAPFTSLGASGGLTGDVDAAIELQYVGGGQWRVLSHEGTIRPF